MKADHVLNAVRGTREGQMYVPEFGQRMHGTGVYARLLQQRFENMQTPRPQRTPAQAAYRSVRRRRGLRDQPGLFD